MKQIIWLGVLAAALLVGISTCPVTVATPTVTQQSAASYSFTFKPELVKYAEQQEFLKTSAVQSRRTPQQANEKLAAMVAEGKSFQEIKDKMLTMGVYLLDAQSDSLAASLRVSSSDMRMTPPIISYSPASASWTITGGGQWKNDNWKSNLPWLWSNQADIGGADGIGVAFTSTRGSYNTSVVKQYAYISDGNGHSVSTYSRSDGNGAKGFGFKLQDYARSWNDGVSYVGKHFAAQVSYGSNFTNYHGVATSYYVHTWNAATLNSVSFGINGKQAGLSFNITNPSYSFVSYSIDKRF